jgi:hypothetical protein
MRGMSGRIGHTSCMNMLCKPRRLRMPDRVEVPTRISASRVAGFSSLIAHLPVACTSGRLRAISAGLETGETR